MRFNIQVSVVLRRTVFFFCCFENQSGSHHQSQVTLMITFAKVVKTSVKTSVLSRRALIQAINFHQDEVINMFS